MFNVNFPTEQCSTISNLINALPPHVNTLQKYCIKFETSIPFISIADIAYLLVQNIRKEWILAIDINVYSKNQQFRLFNSVKYGKNNALLPSPIFPFHSHLQYSFSDLLKKSLITFIDNDYISKTSFENNKFVTDFSSILNSIPTLSHNFININLINEYTDCLVFCNPYTNTDRKHNLSNISHNNKINNLDIPVDDIQMFIGFIENIITCDPSHQDYIHSCVRGTYNKNLLFFNIAGNYRYRPKKMVIVNIIL